MRDGIAMRRIFAVTAGAVLAACGASADAQDGRAMRSGWYLGAGLGAGQGAILEQEGWNRDTFCYPDAACFDETPVSGVPGYRWRYDIALDTGSAFELSLGRFFGRTRLELAFARQTNDTRQVFTGITYLDGAAVPPRSGGTVESNALGSIRQRHVSSATLDAFYDFPGAWGAISPYVGAGAGAAWVEMAGVRFATDYRDATGAAHDPPLAFYNAVQDADLGDTPFVWRMHAGADYALGRRTSVGLRLTWSASGDIEDTGAYETHPMHAIDPAFGNINAFSGARRLTLVLGLRREIGN